MTAPKNNTNEDKAQVSLIPLDLIVPMLEPAYREGLLKYGNETWRAGFESKVMYDALMRHLVAYFFKLESYDPETQEKFGFDKHHLGAAMFCLINLYATDMNFPALDNRPLKLLNDFLAQSNEDQGMPEDIPEQKYIQKYVQGD